LVQQKPKVVLLPTLTDWSNRFSLCILLHYNPKRIEVVKSGTHYISEGPRWCCDL